MIELFALIEQCAPAVHPQTMARIVKTENGQMNPFAVNINGAKPVKPQPKTKAEAIKVIKQGLKADKTVDVGFAQINSANFEWLGLTLEDALDPCKSLAAGAKVLASNYSITIKKFDSEQEALTAAISMYNTGSSTAGFKNGYVQDFDIFHFDGLHQLTVYW